MELARLGYTYKRLIFGIHLLTAHAPLADAARKVEPSLPICNMLHDPKNGVYMIRYDASKSARILGLKYRGMDETVADTIKEFKEKGWLQ